MKLPTSPRRLTAPAADPNQAARQPPPRHREPRVFAQQRRPEPVEIVAEPPPPHESRGAQHASQGRSRSPLLECALNFAQHRTLSELINPSAAYKGRRFSIQPLPMSFSSPLAPKNPADKLPDSDGLQSDDARSWLAELTQPKGVLFASHVTWSDRAQMMARRSRSRRTCLSCGTSTRRARRPWRCST